MCSEAGTLPAVTLTDMRQIDRRTHLQGKGKAASEQVREEVAAPEVEEGPVSKKARGRPSKAASAPEPSKRSNPAKRSR